MLIALAVLAVILVCVIAYSCLVVAAIPDEFEDVDCS